ncbi:MAG: Cd(II)/Pb(II)-responsive transcriptional regulator [Pseudomonadales bacterium]|nr:Cd(II)/Pb(II)-responsive transcriptional regulator [Pseudomonadales bacterium]
MKIGELAKLTGCSVQAIRYYEKEKLLPSTRRSEGNFRLYDEASAEQLLFIKLCRSLDLGLPEIRQLLALKRSPGAQCDEVNHMMEAHIQLVDARIRELTQLNEQLKALRGQCSNQRTVEQCGILQTLSSNKS